MILKNVFQKFLKKWKHYFAKENFLKKCEDVWTVRKWDWHKELFGWCGEVARFNKYRRISEIVHCLSTGDNKRTQLHLSWNRKWRKTGIDWSIMKSFVSSVRRIYGSHWRRQFDRNETHGSWYFVDDFSSEIFFLLFWSWKKTRSFSSLIKHYENQFSVILAVIRIIEE